MEAADKAWTWSGDQQGSVASVEADGFPVSAVTTGASLGAASHAPARGRGQRQRGHGSGKQESKTLTLCHFQLKWGDVARRCLPSCSCWVSRAPPATGFPHPGSLRRQHGLGKLGSRSPSAAVSAIPATLRLVKDTISGRQCLLDSGLQISLWPTSPGCTCRQTSSLRLVAANGTPIRSFGTVRKEIKIGNKLHTFAFIVADIARPILGIDFLQTFKMALELADRQLLHSGHSYSFFFDFRKASN